MAAAGAIRLIGLDPGLRATGWGIIVARGGGLTHIADGVVRTDPDATLAQRLVQIAGGLEDVIDRFRPDEAAVEETFVNHNAVSTLKLGQARGVVLMVAARAGLPVSEYLPNLVKKAVVGAGHAGKNQVQAMVAALLPGLGAVAADAADALAVAICHAHLRQAHARLREGAR